MSDGPCTHEGDRVLLVEGNNDCHVVMALCKEYDVPEAFGIYKCGSDDQVLMRLNALIPKPNGPSHIGVVLDADSSPPSRRLREIRRKITHHGLDIPDALDRDGTILVSRRDDLPNIGIWIMPDNQSSGELEDFCLKMANEEEIQFARESAYEAKRQGCAEFLDKNESKACIHTYLAWREKPGRPLGQAITAEALRPNTVTAEQFVCWLQDLFC